MVNSKRVFHVTGLTPEGFVAMLDRRPDVRLDLLKNESGDSTATPVLAEAHAYQSSSARQELSRGLWTDADLLKRGPNLLLVSVNGAGYDTVTVRDCTDAGVLVVNQSGGNAESVAEHVLGMLICLSKRMVETDRFMRRESGIKRNVFMGTEVLGKTIGIVGLGNVGRRVAELCRGLLRMTVLAYDPYLSAAEVEARGAVKVELDDLLQRADYVSINCPLTDETRGLIGAEQYARMQPHAYLITTARGFIHDERALAEALRSKTIAGAGLDVWEEEPPPHDHPLMAFDNAVISPHTAGVTKEARANMGKFAGEQLLEALDGKRPLRIVNPDVWPVYAKRFERTFGFAPGS